MIAIFNELASLNSQISMHDDSRSKKKKERKRERESKLILLKLKKKTCNYNQR